MRVDAYFAKSAIAGTFVTAVSYLSAVRIDAWWRTAGSPAAAGLGAFATVVLVMAAGLALVMSGAALIFAVKRG